MATPWLKGTVKAVPSGDSLVIMGNTKSGPPPEKTITLAAIIAPKLARRDGKDEPFAWEARESLRKKCIGKEVTLKVDYVVASINREFGSVMLDGQNVAYGVVADGWAKVRPQGGVQANEVTATYMQELEQREAKAQEDGLGIWNKTPGAADAAIRNLPPSTIGDQSNFDAMGFLEANKGAPLEAIVEQVRDASALRVYLLPNFQYVQVYVAGIQAPSMGRRPPTADAAVPDAPVKASIGDAKAPEEESSVGSAPSPLTSAQKLAASHAAASSVEVPPDPFAREAKHFTEVRVLNRDVRIVLEGVDKFGNLIGSVHYASGDTAVNLALELVKQGLARVVDWSANMMEEDSRRALKAAELQAKKDRIRLWTNYTPPASNLSAIRDMNFTGKVIEVVSGDCIVVVDDAAPAGAPPAERRVNLSSVRAPRIGNPRRDEKPAPYAREAKEFLRSRLIGQQVNVVMEYSRKVAPTDGTTPVPVTAPGGDSRMMDFGSVFLVTASKGEVLEAALTSSSGDQPQGVNVAEMVVVRGLATVVRHREFEERSNSYDSLLSAECRAQKGKKGILSGKATPVAHINDLSLQGTSSKARNFLPFLQRQRRLQAVVDYVLSGHRFKLLIPKETCAIAFALSGVRCPGRSEPFSEEAITFMRQKIMQHDVEIEVETVDKTGTFLGTLWEGKKNVSVALLEAGLAKLHPTFSADRTTEGHLLMQSEQNAKKQKLKAWEGFVEGQPEESVEAATDGAKVNQELLEMRVTEVLGGGKFYAQSVTDAQTAGILKQLEAFQLADKSLPPVTFSPKKGDLVMAQYSADNSWNRAMIVSVPKEQTTSPKAEFEIFYIDYGNQEYTALSRLRPAEQGVSFAPGLAKLCKLAYVKVPELEDDNGQEAAMCLSEVIGGKVMLTRTEDKDTSGGKVKGQGTGPCLIVTLVDPENKSSVNAAMVERGLAKVEKKGKWDSTEKKAALDSLLEHEEIARKARQYIWQYGDADSDEEDNLPARGRGGGGRR